MFWRPSDPRQIDHQCGVNRDLGDTSELRIGEQGKAYLAAILDLYSRFVVGWAISAVNDRHLTIKALDMAGEAPLSRTACCIIPIRGRRTPARTTRSCSRRMASPAA